MADYLNELARFAAETTFEDLSEEALSAARNVTLDTFGAISAGMEEPENLKLASWAADNMLPASAGILATPHRASPMAAALVNATAGVALEMDEGNRFGGGHPSIHVLPGLLAESERAGAYGSEFITALVVGYEITSRLGGATSAHPNVHSHGHWGAPGTAAAIARLRGWSVQDIRGAINVAASMSPANTWTNAFEGATVRNLYPGRSSMQGVLAVDLYQCGFTTLDDAPSDVYGSILGESFDTDQAVSGLGSEYRIQQNYFKLHACCRYNHATLDAVVDAVAGATIAPDDVESVTIGVPWMLDGMLGGYPQNMLAAKFNIPYAVAAALATGRTDISVFRPQTVADPSIRSLFDRVTVRVGDVQRQQAITGPGACVEIRTRGGGRLTAAVESIRGDYGSPIPRSDIVDKFSFLAEPVLGTSRTEDAVQRIDSLETVENMGSVVELFQVPR